MGKSCQMYENMTRPIDDVGDVELLSTIAEDIELFTNRDSSWLAEKLFAHKDPRPRLALPPNSDTPAHIIKRIDKKILIVESYDGMRKYIRKTLQRDGYDIVEAVNAEDALTKLSRPEVQMIITNFMLADMNGIELTRTLRTQTPHHSTPVILMTSDNTGAVKDKAIKAGINDWIQKPFKPHQLIKLVGNQINPLLDN